MDVVIPVGYWGGDVHVANIGNDWNGDVHVANIGNDWNGDVHVANIVTPVVTPVLKRMEKIKGRSRE